MLRYVAAIFCVFGLAIGQILFKATAIAIAESNSFFSFKPIVTFLSAACLYGILSIAWVFILQKLPLGRAYPLMALAFIFVPIGSYLFFGEKFAPQYFFGIGLIMLGIIFAVKA